MTTSTTTRSVYRIGHDFDPLARDLVEGLRYAVLGTENGDGTVHLVPVWYLFDSGSFVIETSSTTRKARNVTCRPRASVLVQGGPGWTSAAGTAELVHGPEAKRLNQRVRDRYLTQSGHDAIGRLFDEIDDVAIVVRPEAWKSWTLEGTLSALADRGGDPSEAPRWFRQLDD